MTSLLWLVAAFDCRGELSLTTPLRWNRFRLASDGPGIVGTTERPGILGGLRVSRVSRGQLARTRTLHRPDFRRRTLRRRWRL